MRKTSNKTPQSQARRAPQRTCIACRQVKTKGELARLVRTSRGEIIIDVTGKADGRGAYLCRNPECLEKALSGKQLEHAYKSQITPENRERLKESGKELLKETSGKNQ